MEQKELDRQELNKKFVENHVIMCQSSLVGEMLSRDVFSYDDIENESYWNDEEALYQLSKEMNSNLKLKEEVNNKTLKLFGDGVKNLSDLDKQELKELIGFLVEFDYDENDFIENNEVLEWWVCSDWMIEKLKEIGEPVLSNEFGDWWGRCCSGQAILLDHTIDKLRGD